jgi:hypothetical protein
VGEGTWPTRVALVGRDLTIAGAGRDLTVLDGEGVGTVLVTEDEALALEDLTVTGGLGGRGGGVRTDSNSVVTLTDVTFSGNRAAEGAAVYLDSADLVGTGVRVLDNHSGWRGGGISATVSSTIGLEQSLLAGNAADIDEGGAIYLSGSDATLTNVVIADNDALDGGGIFATGSSSLVELDHVTAAFNQGGALGAFMYLQLGSSAILVDSVVWANHGTEQIGEPNEGSVSLTQTYTLLGGSDLDGAGLPLDYQLYDSPVPTNGYDGNQIDVDPLLLGASDDGDWTNDDWSLDAASPAVDAGDPVGSPDPDASLPDLGAFGGALGAWTP